MISLTYVDRKSFNYCCGHTKQVMVYGWSQCFFMLIAEALSLGRIISKPSLTGRVKYEGKIKVFSYLLGKEGTKDRNEFTTVENRIIRRIPVYQHKGRGDYHAAACKAAITNLILENYDRILHDLPIIPLIFAIDTKNNKHPSTPKTITSREKSLNDLVTHKEIRRCYRITELVKELDIPELDDVIQNTFCFVKSIVKKDGRIILKRRKAPWESKSWKAAWKTRGKSIPEDKPIKPEEYHWQRHFVELSKDYDI